MRLAHILRSKMEWLGRPGATVLSSRIRLARSLRGRPFPNHSEATELRAVLLQAFRACKGQPAFAKAAFVELDDVTELDRTLLVERHVISHQQATAGPDRGVVLSPGESLSVLVNEEDHLRLQGLSPGLSLEAGFERLRRLDSRLGEQLPYAYDDKLGYLTACPTNLGTGLRASCLLHLPALMITGRIQTVLDGLGGAGMVARGIYGEGSRVLGDLFQVSNSTTLGRTEADYIRSVERAIGRLVAREESERRMLLSDNRLQLEDQAARSLGLLLHARVLSFDEALSLLSRVRLGAELGLLDTPLENVDRLFIEARPAHLQVTSGGELEGPEIDRRRAEIVRAALS
jgi:protein arginine kinase